MKANNFLQLSPINDKPMWDIWMSMWHLAVVTVADEIGLFGQTQCFLMFF